MGTLREFQEKFKIKEYEICATDAWIWSLRPHQATIGAGILSLKRECAVFGELKPHEFSDLSNIIKTIEKSLKSAFNYDVINYLMLMMIDKQVHFHVLPRYQKPVEVLGVVWQDQSWPGVPNLLGEALDNARLREIQLYIKSKME